MILGIDLGTTNSLGVVYVDNKYMIIPNKHNELLTPSVIYFDEKNNSIVGKEAKDMQLIEPSAVACLFKRNMGKGKSIKIRNKEYLPEELSALIVKQLIDDAERFLNTSIDEVVISVPAYFNSYQRLATKKIGKILGIKVERLINEPSAAALACRSNNDETFIVLDFGGGTLDISVVDSFDNILSICSIAGDNNLGGSDFDKILVDKFFKDNNITITESNKEYNSILLQCEQIKKQIKKNSDVTQIISYKEKQFGFSISYREFCQQSFKIFEKIRYNISIAMRESGFEKEDIDKLILVGGTCLMPIVQDYLLDLLNIPLEMKDYIDEIVVCGLGTYIGIMQREDMVKNLVLTDICPFSLNTNTFNHQQTNNPYTSTLIKKNSVLPISKSNTYYTLNLGQDKINFDVNQGESIYANDNITLGQILVDVPINNVEYEAVELTYSYDINSLLSIEAKVISTGSIHYYEMREKGIEEVLDLDEKVREIKDKTRFYESREKWEHLKRRFNYILAGLNDCDKEELCNKFNIYEEKFRNKTTNIHINKSILIEFELMLDKYEEKYMESDIFNDSSLNKRGYLS